MNILILGLNYLPESTSIGPYTADLAEYLRARGHDARVVTGFPTAPQWKIWPGYERKFFLRETIRGVPVQRTWLYVPKNPRSTLRRILFDCSFALSAIRGIVTRWRPDVIVAISPPLELALTGMLAAIRGHAPLLLLIKDLVPDAAIATGALRPGSLASRLAHALERFVYRRASAIGVICEGMRRNLEGKNVPGDKIFVLPDYVDLDFIRPHPSNNGFRKQFGIPGGQFLAMYSGSAAGKQGLQTLVEAAWELAGDSDIACCLIGEGPYLAELQQLASSLALANFRFLPLQPRETLPVQLSAADVLIVTQRRAVRDVVFPGKLLYYMAAGRPILAAVSADSETGQFIAEHRVGIVTPPEDAAALAVGIRWLRDNPQKAREFGENGRRTAERYFDRTVVLEKLAECIEALPARTLVADSLRRTAGAP